MSTAPPEVSLVVIAYNEEANIAQCLQSILQQQELDSFEIIVVDDASTDRTSAIVERLQLEHKHIHLIRHPVNRGRGAARRTGQDNCTAGSIGFVDSDIVLPSDWLMRAKSALKDADAVSGVAVPDGDCAVIWRMFRLTSKGMPGYWELTGNNVMFKRGALEQIGWPAESRLTEDCRMARAMVEAGLDVRTLPDLKVEHHEAKNYVRTLSFMREMGFYSTEILRDLRLFRLPDLVWVVWVVVVATSLSLAISGSIPLVIGMTIIACLTIAIDVGAMRQRFVFSKSPLRWLVAALANIPLIVTYLIFRTLHSPRLLLRRRPILA